MASAKEIVGIDYDGPAAAAIPLVLGARVDELYQQRKRALDFADPEGVHDMRVTSRRLRSALRDFKRHLRKAKLAEALEEVKQLADALGEVRDHDVALIALEKLKAKAPPEVQQGLQILIDVQHSERTDYRKELKSLLSERAVSRLRLDFKVALEVAVRPGSPKGQPSDDGEAEGPTYRELGRKTILGSLKDLDKLSPSLYQPLEAKPLHEMRIAAKRFRYALELFAPAWGTRLKTFASQVALLQTDLGELHDCDIWIERFGDRLDQWRKHKGNEPVSNEERAAMIWLMGHFTKLRAKHFRVALTRWHEWQTEGLMEKLTAVLENVEPEKAEPERVVTEKVEPEEVEPLKAEVTKAGL